VAARATLPDLRSTQFRRWRGPGSGAVGLGWVLGTRRNYLGGSWRAVLRQGGETAAMQRSGAAEQHGGGALGFTGGGGGDGVQGPGWGLIKGRRPALGVRVQEVRGEIFGGDCGEALRCGEEGAGRRARAAARRRTVWDWQVWPAWQSGGEARRAGCCCAHALSCRAQASGGVCGRGRPRRQRA
jgi:hypothetical protein